MLVLAEIDSLRELVTRLSAGLSPNVKIQPDDTGEGFVASRKGTGRPITITPVSDKKRAACAIAELLGHDPKAQETWPKDLQSWRTSATPAAAPRPAPPQILRVPAPAEAPPVAAARLTLPAARSMLVPPSRVAVPAARPAARDAVRDAPPPVRTARPVAVVSPVPSKLVAAPPQAPQHDPRRSSVIAVLNKWRAIAPMRTADVNAFLIDYTEGGQEPQDRRSAPQDAALKVMQELRQAADMRLSELQVANIMTIYRGLTQIARRYHFEAMIGRMIAVLAEEKAVPLDRAGLEQRAAVRRAHAQKIRERAQPA